MEKTTKIALSVKVNNDEYIGNYKEVTDKGLEIIHDYLVEIAKGEATYLSLETDRGTVFFSPEILKHSVISILKV